MTLGELYDYVGDVDEYVIEFINRYITDKEIREDNTALGWARILNKLKNDRRYILEALGDEWEEQFDDYIDRSNPITVGNVVFSASDLIMRSAPDKYTEIFMQYLDDCIGTKFEDEYGIEINNIIDKLRTDKRLVNAGKLKGE